MISSSRTLRLAETNLRLFTRDPGPLISRIAQPVLSLLVLRGLYVAALGSTARGTTQVVVGYLVLFSVLGTSVVGNAILVDRQWKTFDRLRASPASRMDLFAGKSIPIAMFVVLQQLVLLGVGVTVLGLRVASYGLLMLVVLVWSVTVLCLGAAAAMVVRSQAQLSAVVDIGASVSTALGGGLVPLSVMPGWARAVAPVSPAYWAVLGFRGALTDHVASVLTSSALLGGVAALSATAACYRLARGWSRDTLL